jgi:hypothetical protein
VRSGKEAKQSFIEQSLKAEGEATVLRKDIIDEALKQ